VWLNIYFTAQQHCTHNYVNRMW